jgi:hypothetical protein
VGLLGRWDASNQRRAERDNERLGGDDWVDRLNEDTPGPKSAWGLDALPLVGWIGAIVIVADAIRRARRR